MNMISFGCGKGEDDKFWRSIPENGNVMRLIQRFYIGSKMRWRLLIRSSIQLPYLKVPRLELIEYEWYSISYLGHSGVTDVRAGAYNFGKEQDSAFLCDWQMHWRLLIRSSKQLPYLKVPRFDLIVFKPIYEIWMVQYFILRPLESHGCQGFCIQFW